MICMKYLNLIFVFLVLVGCSNKGEKQANALLSKSFFLEKSINEINTSHVQNAFSKYQDNIELVKNQAVKRSKSTWGQIQKSELKKPLSSIIFISRRFSQYVYLNIVLKQQE